MTVVIGLTGGIASGKSTVSNMIKEMGITVVDADQISRDVVEIGRPAYNQIIDVFGADILQEDQTLDRGKLGALIFSDQKKREQLNKIVHPEVRKEMLHQVEEEKKQGSKLVVLDIPLLFESKLTYMVDKTILVYVDEETQLERLMQRNNYTNDEAKLRIQSQHPLKDKRKLADEIIDNNGSVEDTQIQLEAVLKKWI
ncbi:dephospho-CoA kinase [Metabacillus schmidteae]|uniref:dephospho-CoA kinase n=1 Tax=Metabacillus schmidteae TaxID=2730405 RepID=UPI00158BE5CE|nr:dephospho-CoA kinase [Metabacillus schmidteae]